MQVWNNLWEWFIGNAELVYVEHPDFGMLDDEGGTYLTEIVFPPTGNTIELLIAFEPPDEEIILQTKFYRWLEGNYAALLPVFEQAFEKAFRNWQPDGDATSFIRGFVLESVHIPKAPVSPTTAWEITFYEGKDLNHWFTIQMIGKRATGYSIDG